MAPRLALAALLAAGLPARAHEGPPFPILEGGSAGPYRVEVWTDPDIGQGEVYVLVRPQPGRSLPPDTRVRVGVRPASGRKPEAFYAAEPKPSRGDARFFAAVPFDSGEVFRLRVQLQGAEGGGEVSAEVKATPAGIIGPVGLLVYLLPFLGAGFLWARAVLKRREKPPVISHSDPHNC